MHERFLGTTAPRYADMILLIELAMSVALLLGALLARKGRFRAHAACQSAVVLLNLLAIVLFMIPSFRDKVAPRIPGRLGRSYYALATTHAALGTTAEVAALYILVAAGTKLLPQPLRVQRYKVWMRSVLALWCVVLLLGLATYARWYIPHSLR